MWQTLRLSQKANADLASSTLELGQRTSAKLILTTGGLYLIWHLAAGLLSPGPGGIGWRVWYVAPAVTLTCGLAWYLLSRHYLLAQVAWHVGLIISVAVAAIVYQQPRVTYLFSLVPLMAVITVGWPAGLVVEALLSGAMWALSAGGLGLLPALATADIVQVVLGGMLSGLLGWAASDSLLTVIYWSLSSFQQAQETMEEMRQNRGQLARVLKDLDQAYYRLQRANAALVAAWKTAAEAERFKAEFATHISHELRTPLNLIAGFSEMMMTAPENYGPAPLPGPYRRDLNTIYRSAQHLLALVDDVIDLARIDAGKIALVRDEVDLAELVREATDMVRDYVSAKGLALKVDVDERLPRLWVDRLRVRQVLLNLLVNAARFTEKGSIQVQVTPYEGEVLVRVSDTGRGIPPADMPRLFEEFHTGEPANESQAAWHSGSGLGLPISRKFVELHGGRMGVESVYGQGTSIWFTLPTTDRERGAGPAPGAAVPAFAALVPRLAPRHGAGERIVVAVSPDPQLARFLQSHLSGCRVVAAASPDESRSLIEDLKPVAVLYEDSAPSGKEYGEPRQPVCAMAQGVPVIACPLPSMRRAAEALGVQDILIKPVSKEDLYAAIERAAGTIRRVLIVDDDAEMVRMFQRMLAGRLPPGACLEAYDGPEALSLLRSAKPDLLLLDLGLPGKSGEEVLREKAAEPALAAIPTIVISAHEGLAPALPGEIRISRGGYFELGEVLRVLDALFGALGQGWGEAA